MEAKNILKTVLLPAGLFVVVVILGVACSNTNLESPKRNAKDTVTTVDKSKTFVGDRIILPNPTTNAPLTLERALGQASTSLDYTTGQPLSLENLSQLLFAADGNNNKDAGIKTIPTKKGIDPLNIYAVIDGVNTLETGIYQYLPEEHKLGQLQKGDVQEDIIRTIYSENAPNNAPVILVIVGDTTKAQEITPDQEGALQLLSILAGHSAQNVYLEAGALDNVGVGTMTAFDQKKVQEILNLPENETPIILIPTGKKKP